MTKRISSLFLAFFVLTLVFTTVFASAATKKVAPMGTPNPEYPGTNIEMQIGDVLYSSKSLDGSAAIVGHVGIVGDDFRVYHVNPVYENGYNGGKSDSINEYMHRHKPGETITIYKSRAGDYASRQAANWAKNNYYRINSYVIPVYNWQDARLGSINPSYCSKFLWQAFYYGNNNKDLVVGYYTDSKEALVTPSAFTGSNFAFSGSFTAVWIP